MASIEFAVEVAQDIDRIVEHLHRNDAAHVNDRIAALIDAIAVLEHSPLIGRRARGDLRELIVGRDHHGYVVLYRFIPELDTALILAVRSQREAGYRGN